LLAPAALRVRAHSFQVAPVVLMSSIRQTVLPAKGWSSRTAKAPATFLARAGGVAAVQKMAIGVGDRNNPRPGGTGRIYIDDIRLTKRML